ncbi:MHO_1580 family protein [Mycoplasma sp. 1654_15]|uniref:MHO_1580 family protein n=1 Tax=Mycoplasma sp. 1654_15 TaxID=2725994 RepID=UPI001448FCFE|nr:hypothetical protein [Mycoplasma sp. 1654_15]QJB71388.1 hypothetical protein HF996_02825 [Mycoplasma sp. 1654_15]
MVSIDHSVQIEEQIQSVNIYSNLENTTRFTNFAGADDRQYIEINRNIKLDSFSVKVTYFSRNNIDLISKLQINNKDTEIVNNLKIFGENFAESIFPFVALDKFNFSKLNALSIVSEIKKENKENLAILSQIKFSKNPVFKKDFFINSQGIVFKSIKTLNFASFAVKNNKVFDSQFEKQFYNNIYFFSVKWEVGKHNKIVYKVAIENDVYDENTLDRDLSILPKKLTNLPIDKNESLDLHFVLRQDKNAEYVLGKKIIGDIVIANNTYYDSDKKIIVKGIQNESKQGFLIPYNFSGYLNPISTLFLNADYPDISLAHRQEIKHKFLDKTNGLLKLDIQTYKDSFLDQDQFIILENKNFKYISSNEMSLEVLKSLYIKEENEELSKNEDKAKTK